MTEELYHRRIKYVGTVRLLFEVIANWLKSPGKVGRGRSGSV